MSVYVPFERKQKGGILRNKKEKQESREREKQSKQTKQLIQEKQEEEKKKKKKKVFQKRNQHTKLHFEATYDSSRYSTKQKENETNG